MSTQSLTDILVVAAAVRRADGLVCSLPQPARHHHVVHMLSLSGWEQREGDEQGFLLSNGMFALRKAAASVAIRSGQIDKLDHPPNLYSEDLW